MLSVKAPEFWQQPKSWQKTALKPLSCLWALGAYLHRKLSHPQKLEVPVISVGNWTLGGGGKTPLALWLLENLSQSAVISRGYTGSLSQKNPVPVDVKNHTAQQVGDEALLLAQKGPTWICTDRAYGAKAAIQAGTRLIILDDGHQNYHVYKDLSLIVIDGTLGLGNGQVCPAGPLRGPFKESLATTDAVLIIGPDKTGLRHLLPKGLPVFQASLIPQAPNLPKQGPIAAFAGIAYPQKFLRTLKEIGITPHPFLTYPDHYFFQKPDMDLLKEIAKTQSIVTTAKDWVRLPDSLKSLAIPIPVTLKPEDSFLDFIYRHLDQKKGTNPKACPLL
jgi:tetraacyldisaccharide 4'-kinase